MLRIFQKTVAFLCLVGIVGLALPTAASLLLRGASGQSSGFPFTLWGISIGANSTTNSIPGITTASVTDPILDDNCSGAVPSTLGTISSSSNSLVVASAAGWAQGMGISVAGAGSAGANLQTTISNITGTTFTLGATASTSVTSQAVTQNFDTTGTISSGTNSLVVASASNSTWAIGQGIAVQNAGAGGTTELITYISNISGTTFTLHDNAAATATTKNVNHDDTRCLTSAIASGKNIHLRLGGYNVTSALSITAPLQIIGEGMVDQGNTYTGNSSTASTAGGSVIWNRGKTNDVFDVTSGYVYFDHITVEQNPNITPTAGYAWAAGLGSSSNFIVRFDLHNSAAIGTFQSYLESDGVFTGMVFNNIFACLGGVSNANECMHVENHSPGGDVEKIGNQIIPLSNGRGLLIADADTANWTANKFNHCDPCVRIEPNGGDNVIGQSFVNNQFESGANSNPLIVVNHGTNGNTFIGGLCGVDNGQGCFNIGASASVAIIGVNFSFMTGPPITNTSSGIVIQRGNISSNGTTTATIPDTASDGTAGVDCGAGISATTGRAVGGTLTHC